MRSKNRLLLAFILAAALLMLQPTYVFGVACPIAKAGCYKVMSDGSIAKASSRIGKSEFAYYLPQDSCTNMQTDADNSKEACECISGTDWNANAKCCGDDASDCAKLESGLFCSIDETGSSSQWTSISSGSIVYAGCARAEYLSKVSSMKKCDGTFWKESISNRDYICIGQGGQSIVECCGDSSTSCKSTIGGKRLTTGQSSSTSQYENSGSIPNTPSQGIGVTPPVGECAPAASIGKPPCESSSDNPDCYCPLGSDKISFKSCTLTKVLNPDYPSLPGDYPTSPYEKCSYTTRYTCSFRETNDLSPCWTDNQCPNGYECMALDSPKALYSLSIDCGWAGGDHISWEGNLVRSNEMSEGIFAQALKNYHRFRWDEGGMTELVRGSIYSTDFGWGVDGHDIVNYITCFVNKRNNTKFQHYSRAVDDLNYKGTYTSTLLTSNIPTLTSISPTTVTRYQQVTYILQGSNFKDGSLLMWTGPESGSQSLTFVSGNELRLTAVEGSLPGTYKVWVRGPYGEESNKLEITIIAEPNANTYYCKPDKTFATDLDTPESQKDNTALNSNNKKTCELAKKPDGTSAGLKWTGTKCCSEADDIDEYYNDQSTEAGAGGCWKSKFVQNGNFVAKAVLPTGLAESSVVNVEGVFYGCNLPSSFDINSIRDKHKNEPLIAKKSSCEYVGGDFYCSTSGRWELRSGADKSHTSNTPNSEASGCCAQNECFNGESCIANQKGSAIISSALTSGKYRCIDGEWKEVYPKVAVDGTQGYCQESLQCLLNPAGTTDSAQCIGPGSYSGDNYCESGEWSSRTKLLALKLLKLKSGNDYALFCDTKDNTLNYLQYAVEAQSSLGGATTALNILSSLQTNNICVLSLADNIITAASVNMGLQANKKQLLKLFGVSSCDASDDSVFSNDGEYHYCDSGKKIWFNQKLQSFIHSKNGIQVPQDAVSFEEFIRSPIQSIIDSIKRLIASPPYDESYLTAIKRFGKLYMTQQSGKTIRGSIESGNAVIKYENFDADVCNFIDKYAEARKDVSSGASCSKEGNSYYVLVQGSQFTSINPDAIWPDLTSKLRIK